MDKLVFAKAGEIIPDDTGKPAYKLLGDLRIASPIRGDDFLDLATGRHPEKGTQVPDFVTNWAKARIAEIRRLSQPG